MSATITHIAARWTCNTCGSDLQAACEPTHPRACCITPELIVRRLEQAGSTMLAMRTKSPYPAGIKSCMPDVLPDAWLAYGWNTAQIRPATPTSQQIDAMDAAYRWLSLIPDHRYVVRRILACRSLVHPITDRHVLHWRKIGTMLGADYRAIQTWHRHGVGMIVGALT